MRSKGLSFVRENTWYQMAELFEIPLTASARRLWLREARSKSEQLKRDLGLRSPPLLIEERIDGLSLKITGIAGTLRLFGTYLQVAPKFVTEESFVGSWQSSILAMLYRARRKHYTYSPIKGATLSRATFMDHVALAYTDAIETALRGEAIQVYKVKEETSPYLRGRLAVARQMQVVLARPQHIQCDVDYLETDNQFNHLLHWAGNRFLTLVFDRQVRRTLSATLNRLPKLAGPPSVPVHLPAGPPPQYKHYVEALEIASVLAKGYSHGQEAGRFAGYGYVLNMEKLFEGFVEKTFAHVTNLIDTQLTVRPQVSRIYANALGHAGRSYFTRPDNVLFREGKAVLMVDAKYKGFSESEIEGKRPQNSDIYQLFASMVSHECDRGLLVYPRTLSPSEPREGRIRLWRIPIEARQLLVGAVAMNMSDLSTKSSLTELDNVIAKVTREMLSHDVGVL